MGCATRASHPFEDDVVFINDDPTPYFGKLHTPNASHEPEVYLVVDGGTPRQDASDDQVNSDARNIFNGSCLNPEAHTCTDYYNSPNWESDCVGVINNLPCDNANATGNYIDGQTYVIWTYTP